MRRRKNPIPMTDDGAIKVTPPKTAHANGVSNGGPTTVTITALGKSVELPPKPRAVTRYIDHKLTPAEKIQRGVEHRKILAQIDDAKASAKEDASEHKSRINALAEAERAKRIAADTGVERRAVACEERRNEAQSTIETVRLDTGKIIDARSMDANERQLVIPGTGVAATEVREPSTKKRRASKIGKQAEATAAP